MADLLYQLEGHVSKVLATNIQTEVIGQSRTFVQVNVRGTLLKIFFKAYDEPIVLRTCVYKTID